MNERIIELAEQAGLEYNFDPMLWLKYEKFVELIVMECLTICEELGDKGMDGHYCADEISKTFRR